MSAGPRNVPLRWRFASSTHAASRKWPGCRSGGFGGWRRCTSRSCPISRPYRQPEVQTIAEQSFVTSRFFIDPLICPQRGAARYATWVRNSAKDPAQQVLVAELEGEIAGFFIVQEREQAGQRSAYWHLTAVAAAFQGRGVGKRLWRMVMNWHREHGCRQLRTAISGHNLPVLALYGQLGFRFERAETTLHRGALPPLGLA
jgi:GNAT superfamily N-acetyltransferase